ncbi:methyl-accepting chemotaxis protein [Paenibacillus sp. 1_12]|uniref:methyl-accepting chemotaxis protein n=1 Tax=Paenibacillus sp. 1_12 TaxID=1566278 RepID=UPI0008E06471|nr:methyl-accepting chemotaxis protein [Paenibacillus sp. 1_12]SFK92969.1 methyl-accepting chemotaxis protein [Paenibacillus sp. 1_12]
MITLFRKHLVLRIVAAITAVILLLSGGYILLQILNTKSAAQEVITDNGMRTAHSYAAQLDTRPYEEFLANPQENELYWSLRSELDRFRTQIGAMYVYFVRIDEQQQPKLMIDGQPRSSQTASPINEVTDIPKEAITALMMGENANSPLIEDAKYGKYISAYAPVMNANGKLIGVLGIDTAATVVDSITMNVLGKSIYFYILMLVVTLVCLGFIVWFVVRALRPLRVITSSAESMATGDLAQAKAILLSNPVKSQDEIGTAYQAMIMMSGNLNEIIRTIVSKIAQTSDQMVSSSARFKKDAVVMLDMNAIIRETIQQIMNGARSQKLSADDSSLAMEEIAVGIQRIAESSMTVSDAAVSALEVAAAGKDTSFKMKHQIDSISSKAGEAVASVTDLKQYSSKIEDVLSAITDFSNQTKLLALNASIEAARAGEHGKGFAVVAGEVRKLAEASFASVQSIASLLHNIEQESQRIGDKMDDVASEIQEGVALSEQAEQSFERVVEVFRLVTMQIQEVSAAAQQMSAGSEEVAASVNGIAYIAKEVSEQTDHIHDLTNQQLDKMRHVADASSILSGMTQDMIQAVQQVKV